MIAIMGEMRSEEAVPANSSWCAIETKLAVFSILVIQKTKNKKQKTKNKKQKTKNIQK
jgi:hypothetical protein